MTRYADPSRCPDCGATITPGAVACGTCALSLTGDTAARLFSTLSQADGLLASLRAASAPSAPAVVAGPSATSRDRVGAAMPPAAGSPRRAGRSAASVPQLLLALGAGCLLVAALVFLAVTWSVLGVGGRTATLVGFTAVCAGLAGWTARRGLRGTAESLALVGFGLLSLDVVGAEHAGWFGDLSTAGLLVLIGTALALSGVAAATAVRRTALPALLVGEVVVAAGTALVSSGFGAAEWLPVSPSLVVATLVGVAATVASRRLHLSVAATGAAVVTGAAWLCLTAQGLDRALGHATWGALWLHLDVWPLLVAAALVAVLAPLRELPAVTRVTAAAVAELVAVTAVVIPFRDSGPTTQVLVGLVVLAVVGTLGWFAPMAWRLTAAATQAVAGTALLVAGLAQGLAAARRLLDAAEPVWAGRPDDRLPALLVPDLPAPWLLPLIVLALLGTLAMLAEASKVVDRSVSWVAELQTWVVGLLAASLVGALALYPVSLWLVVGVLLVVAVACIAWCLLGDATSPLVPASVFLGAALAVGLHAAWLTAAGLVVALALTAVVQLCSRSVDVSAVAGALLSATLAGAVWTAGHLLGAERTWTTLVGLLALGALVLLAPYGPSRWWVCADPTGSRTGLEAGAAAAAVPLALAGVLLASEHEATWTAGYLTAGGVVVTAMSLLREDRQRLAWLGGGLLALASWVRLWDLGVRAPEAYTLPSAAVLLAVGMLHLRRAPQTGTMTALAPGLSLALVPSLLWALSDPTGPRPLLLGLAALALVLVGARLRWTAPLLLGAGVGAVLVLRLAAPYIGDAVPRWVLIGFAGALLIGVGATWEHRLADARQMLGYVRGLR